MKNRLLSVLLVFVVAACLFSGPVRAASCNLDPVVSKPTPLTLQIDYKPQNLVLKRQYTFAEKGGNVVVTRTGFIGFEDFNAVFKRFAQLHLQPKSRCDILRPVEFSTAVDPSTGMAFSNFTVFYEDNLCFPLRFFDPPANPGVTKEAQSYKSASQGFAVQSAFRPKMKDGVIYVDMAVFYGNGGQKVLKKLSKSQLDGFLQDQQFIQLIYAALQNEGFEARMPPQGFGVADMRFTTDSKGMIQIALTTQKTLPAQQACDLRSERLKSGVWHE